MVYETGIRLEDYKPDAVWQLTDEANDYTPDQVGRIDNIGTRYTFLINILQANQDQWILDHSITEKQYAERVIASMKNGKDGHFANVTYIRVKREISIAGDFWALDYVVESMHFVGGGIAPLIILAIILAIGAISTIVIVAVVVVFAPVYWKNNGLSPEEIGKYVGAAIKPITDPLIIIAIMLGALVILGLFGGGFNLSKKGVSVTGAKKPIWAKKKFLKNSVANAKNVMTIK